MTGGCGYPGIVASLRPAMSSPCLVTARAYGLASIGGAFSFATTTRPRVPGPAAGGRVPGVPSGPRQGVFIPLAPRKGMPYTPWIKQKTLLTENGEALWRQLIAGWLVR